MGIGHLNSFTLKVLTPVNRHLALSVARTLPEWFTENGIALMGMDLVYQRGALAMDGEDPIGFISFFVNQGKAEIGWMAVMPKMQDQGVGKFLLGKLVTELTMAGISEISVRTLGDGVDYEPYARTRAFYRAYGFQDAGVKKNPGNSEYEEELLLVLRLS